MIKTQPRRLLRFDARWYSTQGVNPIHRQRSALKPHRNGSLISGCNTVSSTCSQNHQAALRQEQEWASLGGALKIDIGQSMRVVRLPVATCALFNNTALFGSQAEAVSRSRHHLQHSTTCWTCHWRVRSRNSRYMLRARKNNRLAPTTSKAPSVELKRSYGSRGASRSPCWAS